jgi:hypothetical protein
MSADQVLPLGWSPGTDPSMDAVELKEPPQIEPAKGIVGNP